MCLITQMWRDVRCISLLQCFFILDLCRQKNVRPINKIIIYIPGSSYNIWDSRRRNNTAHCDTEKELYEKAGDWVCFKNGFGSSLVV